MKITFTGHRPDKLKNSDGVKKALKKKLEAFFTDNQGDHEFLVGGCPGFDCIALELLLEMGHKDRITLVVPFRGFEKFAGYNHQVENARVHNFNYTCGVKVIEVGGADGSYGQKCNRRNAYLIAECQVLFTYWDGSLGGTANTVKMAKKKSLSIIPLDILK